MEFYLIKLYRKIKNTIIRIIETLELGIDYSQRSFSQEGEDIALARLIGQNKNGFYVEVGSHHPFRFSNTYLFYRKGWKGICIDPLPCSKIMFNKYRPRDIAIEAGVSKNNAQLKYFMFNEPALNTFDENLAKLRDGLKNYKIIDEKIIKTTKLSDLLSEYINKNQKIDFYSIDVEGLDIEVLESNNWSIHRPDYIIAESNFNDLSDIKNDKLYLYLHEQNYSALIKTGSSIIFKNIYMK
jgi:hypothetical protein